VIVSNTKISHDFAQNIALKCFNVSGVAMLLHGETDYNFKIETPNNDIYLLKISRPDENEDYLDFQQTLLKYLEDRKDINNAPQIIHDKKDRAISYFIDSQGDKYFARLLTWVPGRIWSSVNPQLDNLRFNLGEQAGLLTKALIGFDHPEAHRKFEWDLSQALWIKDHFNKLSERQKDIVLKFTQQFETFQNSYTKLRKSVVHNDLNDNNIIVSNDLKHPQVKAAIDYGDAMYTQIINDVAITCAYAIMHHNDPLEASLPVVKGYHASCPLKERELAHLYTLIAMRLAVSVVKSAINKIKEPNNSYLAISEQPAWDLLKKWGDIDSEFAYYSFRNTCGFSGHPSQELFKKWTSTTHFTVSDLF